MTRLAACLLLLLQATGQAGDVDTHWDAYRRGTPHFNEKEKALWNGLYPTGKSCLKLSVDEAFKAANQDAYKNTTLNGPGDAVRHCVWNCEMARCFGVENAKQWADAHESNPSPAEEKKMDFHNNHWGRELWKTISKEIRENPESLDSNGRCKLACEDALKAKKLMVLPPETWR